jgi:hypothetical protein
LICFDWWLPCHRSETNRDTTKSQTCYQLF